MNDDEKDLNKDQNNAGDNPPGISAIEEAYAKALADMQSAGKAAEQSIVDAYNIQETALGKLISDAEILRGEQQKLDEKAQKREKAYRYISGIGDAISGVANLVGTSHGAANQEQHYNAPAVIQKAEAARKERKLEMDKINERLKELSAQKTALAATKEMKLGEVRAKNASGLVSLELQKVGAKQQQSNWNDEMQYRKSKDAADAAHREKVFEEGKSQFDEEQGRLAEQSKEKLETEKAIAQIKAQAEMDKRSQDPEHQSKVLQSNITGIRDELAQKMGYKDYNEYLRYKNVSGWWWGEDIEGQSNSDSREIRDTRASQFPETAEFLKMLEDPSVLGEEQIRVLMSASKVFADAVGAASVETEEAKKNPSNGKKKVW